MSRGDACNHPNCDGGPCKQLTPEELAPTDEDLAVARQLIADGFKQTSARYRSVGRLLDNPEGWVGYEPAWVLKMNADWKIRCVNNPKLVEHRELTVKQFKAFKRLGGRVA